MTKLCPRGKAAAKRKFKVYPSAYANAYASKICAGKAKDPSGVKRKDWGPKKANKGAMMKKYNKGDEIKIKRIDPLAERMSKTGFVPGGGKGVSKAKVKNKKPMTTEQVAAARRNQLPISTKMEGKKYGLKIPTKRFDSKGKDKFAQFKKLVLKKRNRKNPTRDFLPRAGQTTIREAHYQTYGPNYKKTKKPDDKFEKYSKGGNMKVKKAGLGMIALMNHMKKEGKQKGRAQAEEGMKQDKQYQEYLASKKGQGMNTANMSVGGMPEPTGSGSYIKQDIDGDESFTNASAQAYYKDLLD